MQTDNKKKKFKINGKLIFNILVFGITIYLIIYFFISENGMIDLFKSSDSFNIVWIIVGIIVYDLNILFDTFVTMIFIRSKYPHFRFIDALKIAMVGVFFGAVTPSNTGGQPMQLYLMSKMNVSVGFGSACMTQKFIVYQIITGIMSVLAIIIKFDYFKSAFTGIWSALFIILGFLTQLAVTILFLVVSFSHKTTTKLIGFVDRLMHKLKFIKNPDDKIKSLKEQVEIFHEGNKMLFENPKMLVGIYVLVFLQILTILSIPYFVYLSFDLHNIAIANSQVPLNLFDTFCIQSFVLFTSNLVPLPGASGGAELAFSMYFGSFFIFSNINKIKPAILLWRFSTYYASIIITAPFSYLTRGKKVDEVLQKELETKDN